MMNNREKCIVFGGNGFIGKHLVQELNKNGHEVSVFARTKPRAGVEGVDYIYGDFMNAHDIDEAVSGHDYVFHLVSLTNPAISDKDPFVDLETNVKMSVHLLDSCVKHKVKRVIYSSSGGAIYGNIEKDRLHESDMIAPVSPYGIGKAAIEGYLRYFNAKHDLDYMALRISNVYGEGQDISKGNHGVIPIFLSRIENDQQLTVLGDGSMTRDYIYVKDLTQFIGRTFKRDHKEKVYNVGSGRGTTVNEVLQTVEKVTGKTADVIHLPTPASFVHSVVLDTSRAEAEFGSFATTDIESGVANLYTPYKDN